MDLLDKLNERLVLAVAAAGENAFPGGLTVADVYQRLIPYRVVRGHLGVVELAEYEHAMLRLLSGERHYVDVIDPDVRIEIQRELASLNPILGIYRDYSAAQLRLAEGSGPATTAMQSISRAVETPDSRPRERFEEVADDDTSDPPAAELELLRASPVLQPIPRDQSAVTESQAGEEACDGCGRELPDLPEVRFCPFCGIEQGPVPCARCGAPMDRDWTFCTRCGAGRGGAEA